MIEKKVSKLIIFVLVAALLVWIFMNTYADIYANDSRAYIVNSLNEFFGSAGLGYRFGIDDFVAAVRFLEYFILGILIGIIYKLYGKSIIKVWSMPLFIGLLVSVGEVYYKFLRGNLYPVSIVVVSFVSFILGMILCVLITSLKKETRKNFKYNSRKYRRR